MANEQVNTNNTDTSAQQTSEAPAANQQTQAGNPSPKLEKSLLGGEQQKAEGEGKPDLDAKTQDQKKEGEQQDKNPADAVPEKYDIKMPDGVALDAAALEAATPVFKELGLSNEKAQKLVGLQTQLLQEHQKNQLEKQLNQRLDWQNQIKAVPDYEKTLSQAKQALKKFGDPETLAMFENGWIGDHPALIKFLAKIGKATQDDTFVEGGNAGGERKSTAEIFYK